MSTITYAETGLEYITRKPILQYLDLFTECGLLAYRLEGASGIKCFGMSYRFFGQFVTTMEVGGFCIKNYNTDTSITKQRKTGDLLISTDFSGNGEWHNLSYPLDNKLSFSLTCPTSPNRVPFQPHTGQVLQNVQRYGQIVEECAFDNFLSELTLASVFTLLYYVDRIRSDPNSMPDGDTVENVINRQIIISQILGAEAGVVNGIIGNYLSKE